MSESMLHGQGAPQQGPRLLDQLETMQDSELQELVKRAQKALDSRAEKRKRDAVEEIRKLAQAHGLNVEVKGPRKRRGRPPNEKCA